ncbi:MULTISPECIES: alpha/beta hydrolase [Mycolicibacterium]|uniref:Alpha/beta hydrolase n=1 Tax=Mycolicibacterium wolinskyi TaxID=59750 RepID=A0A1X2F466_9MYCO|nr:MULTISPECIES: alpha/beta hydrolase [Mycolicibacterium]ORX13230.1 alpha/beta hydrolase [Mycolicibacterium wolinskyi]
MGALDGFYSTWNKARETFGQGTPDDGSQFDGSSRLMQMKASVEAAAPDDRWQGSGSQAYAAANKEHAAVYEKLAELDKKMAGEVKKAADVVNVGRTNLDTAKSWVESMVDSLPATSAQDRENKLVPIAKEGITKVDNIVKSATDDMTTIKGNVDKLKGEYDTLTEQKFGPDGDKKPGDADMLTDEEERDGEGDETKTDMSSGDIEAVDNANRALLDQMRQEYEQLPDGQVKTDRLADIAAIEEALKVDGSHLVYLEKPADPSQMIPAATSVGDPFKADHVSVTVPGVGSTTRDAVAGMTGEAAALRNEAIEIAEREGESTNIATVSWVGYQPPLNLGQSSVLNDDLAQAGAPKLTSFLHDLDAASRNPGQTTALFGHSYGSLTSGIAMKEGASQYLDNAVLYGSPGFQADTPAELGMTDDNFFVMSAPDDPINTIGALAPLHGWGSDPNDIIREGDGHLRYRFEHLETDAGNTPIADYESKTGASGHSEYPQNAGDRMTGYNLAAILLDRPDLTVKATPPEGRLTW